MIQELQSLTTKHRRDRQLTRRNLTTRIPATPGPHSEFKTFLTVKTRQQTESTTDRPSGSPRYVLPASPSRHERQTSQEGRRSADRHATTESRHRDSDDDVVEELGSLGIRSRHDSPPEQERGYAYYGARPAITEQSARHSIDRLIAPEDDQDRRALDANVRPSATRRPSRLEPDAQYDRVRTDSYKRASARTQTQRDDSQRRQSSPVDSSGLQGRHASISQDPSRHRGADSWDAPSRQERPPTASIVQRQTSPEAAKGKRNEGTLRSQGLNFFVPNEDVDIKVLATYLKEYVDPEASMERSKHPKVSIETRTMGQKTNSSRTPGVLAFLCTQAVP